MLLSALAAQPARYRVFIVVSIVFSTVKINELRILASVATWAGCKAAIPQITVDQAWLDRLTVTLKCSYETRK
jgi:hypothetical protein